MPPAEPADEEETVPCELPEPAVWLDAAGVVDVVEVPVALPSPRPVAGRATATRPGAGVSTGAAAGAARTGSAGSTRAGIVRRRRRRDDRRRGGDVDTTRA